MSPGVDILAELDVLKPELDLTPFITGQAHADEPPTNGTSSISPLDGFRVRDLL